MPHRDLIEELIGFIMQDAEGLGCVEEISMLIGILNEG